MYVNSQISRKKVSGKRQTNNFRSVAAFSVDILGLWTVSRATAIILSWQRLSKKGPQGHFQGPSKTFTGSSSKLNAQGAKCQSCVFFDTMPFLMELKDDDIGGRGHVPYIILRL